MARGSVAGPITGSCPALICGGPGVIWLFAFTGILFGNVTEPPVYVYPGQLYASNIPTGMPGEHTINADYFTWFWWAWVVYIPMCILPLTAAFFGIVKKNKEWENRSRKFQTATWCWMIPKSIVYWFGFKLFMSPEGKATSGRWSMECKI